MRLVVFSICTYCAPPSPVLATTPIPTHAHSRTHTPHPHTHIQEQPFRGLPLSPPRPGLLATRTSSSRSSSIPPSRRCSISPLFPHPTTTTSTELSSAAVAVSPFRTTAATAHTSSSSRPLDLPPGKMMAAGIEDAAAPSASGTSPPPARDGGAAANASTIRQVRVLLHPSSSTHPPTHLNGCIPSSLLPTHPPTTFTHLSLPHSKTAGAGRRPPPRMKTWWTRRPWSRTTWMGTLLHSR